MIHLRLQITLSLEIGDTSHTVPGGDVCRVELELLPHGFSGRVAFWIKDDDAFGGGEKDPLLKPMLGTDLIRLRLELVPLQQEKYGRKAPPGLTLNALIGERRIREETVKDLEGQSVLFRRYELSFADAAQLLWRQHRPLALYTDKPLADVLKAHTGPEIQLELDWTLLTEDRPQTFLGLDRDPQNATLYDFVVWLAHTRNGHWWYDYPAAVWRLTGERSAEEDPGILPGEQIEGLELCLPPVPRHNLNVLNAFAGASTRKWAVEFKPAVEGIRQDVLVRVPLDEPAEALKGLEEARLLPPVQTLRLELKEWPIAPFLPHACLKPADGKRWPARSVALETSWRVIRTSLEATATAPEPGGKDHLNTDASYAVVLRLELEDSTAKAFSPPPHVAPVWPRLVEGVIVSELGEKEDETYEIREDEDTALEYYRISLPLFEDQEVVAPYDPGFSAGQLYLPLLKGTRVLVALNFDGARIERVLTWRGGARLPVDAQGHHLLMGRSTKHMTSLKHDEQDDKPVFRLERRNESDVSSLELREGRLVIEVMEEGG